MGDLDAIILTGGLAYDKRVTEWVSQRVQFIGPVIVYPGEDELTALAETVGNALAGLAPIHTYEKAQDRP